MTMTRNTQPGQVGIDSFRSISRSWTGPVSRPEPNGKSLEGAETQCCTATDPKPERSGEDLYGGVGQNPCCSVCKIGQELHLNSNCKKDSIDDVLGDLLGDDDPSPPRQRRAPSLASTNRNRSVLSSTTKKSLFEDDDFYNQLAKEAAQESDVSEGDAQALLENLKDLDDMDAELFESRKPKSAPAKNSSQAKSSDKTVGARRGTSAPESEKKPMFEPVGQSRPYKKFSFDDGNKLLDGIVAEDNNEIANKSNPVKSSEAVIVSPSRPSPASHRKNDVNFEEDADYIMDALGFGDHLESPHKEKSSASRRSKFDELLGRGTSAKLLERPLTGETKEFKLDPKYQKMAEKGDPLGDEDLGFGSYQPTMAFSPEGRPSRRSSVRFSAESNGAIKADARSRSATPVGRSPARDEKSGADWLGLKDEDVPDLTPLREPPRPSNVERNTTGRPPSGTKSDSRLATQIKTSQIGTPAVQQDDDDDDEWLMSSLSRNKALKQEKLEEQKVQNRNDVKETSVGSSPVGSGNTIQQSDRGKTIQEIAPVLAEVSGPPLPWEIGVKTPSTTTPTSSITPTSSRQKENLVPAPSTTPSEMYRDTPATVQPKIQEGKKEIHGDVLHNKLLDLETQIRKLHLEREQQNLLLETLQQRHKEDLELIESAHRTRLKLLEDSSRQREERLRQENQELSAQYISHCKGAEHEKADLHAQYQKKLTEFQQEKDMEIERIRELQRVSVQEMCKDHEDQLQRLKRLKDQEIDAVTSANSHTRSLNGIIEQMESFSHKLSDLSVRVQSTQINTSQELELGARQREGQLRALQERLTRQQTDMEDERNNLRVIITNMETRLNEQSRLLEQERWRVSAEQAKVQTLQRSLEEEKRVMTQQISMEREELERAKSALLGEHQSVMTRCEEERKKLAAEWSEYHTQQKLSKERAEKDVTRTIMVESQRESAIISLAKEQAELKVQFRELRNKEQQLALDMEALEKERQELRLEKERVNSSALRVRQRAEEVESVSKLASQRYEDGEKALGEARKVESGHQERLRSIQGQLEYLRQREEHLHQEHINLAHQRRQLEQLRQGLPTAPLLVSNRDLEPQQIHPLSTSLLLNGLPHAVPSTTGVGSGAQQERVPQKSELHTMLAVYKVQAQQDWDYIENEKLYLEALKKSSSYPLSV
ncbi:fas-binding factor 1 isoform X2 [Ranitomeya imitator]|uniref:fas-binding factor 1 isoform X2 n=1 Tax=Ranitomeya imitator TaxID=111125 RepID=UPI0037E94587